MKIWKGVFYNKIEVSQEVIPENTEEKEMLKSILDFDKVTVYDVMNHRKNLFALDIDMPIKKMFEKINPKESKTRV